MSWLAFLGVLVAVSLIDEQHWLTIQQSECLLNNAARCNLLFAYSVTTLIWFGITISLLAVEAVATELIRNHWHAEHHTDAVGQPAPRHPILRFVRWIEKTTIWPTAPRLSRSLVFWLAAVGMASYSLTMAQQQLPQYALITMAWAVAAVIASSLHKTSALANMLLGPPLSLLKRLWLSLVPRREIQEPPDFDVQSSDQAAMRILGRITLYFTVTLFTLFVLQEVPDQLTTVKLIRYALFAVLLMPLFQSGWRPLVPALLGLFTIDQYLLRIMPDNNLPELPLNAHELAMFLVFVLIAWNSQQLEQTLRYRLALQAEQLRFKKSQQMQQH